MMNDKKMLNEIAAEFGPEQSISTGKWFGKPCLKVGGRVFAVLRGGDLAFKLAGAAHAEALQLEGAHLFDPRGKGHPMKQWVQIPAAQSSAWGHFARLARDYVAGGAQAEKNGIIRGLVKARRKILDAAGLLSPAQQDEVSLGVWSVKDLLAHLAGWDYTNLKAVQEILAGQKPSFWEYHDRDWQSYNARLVAEYKRDDFVELVTVVEESHRKLIDFLQGVPAEEYLRRREITRLLRAESRDEEEHHRQLQEFRKRRGA
jgi:uncharacterized damage-inducible protein DinB